MVFKTAYLYIFIAVIGTMYLPSVYGQVSTIEVQRNNQVQTLQVQTIRIKEVAYVDFPKLVERVGGAYTVLTKRMRIDLEGTTAWVGLNDNRVNALSIFSLSHLVVANEQGIFISLKDCVPFFSKAFRITLSYSDPVDPGDTTNGNGLPGMSPDSIGGFEGDDGSGARSNFFGQSSGPRAGSEIRTILLDAGHGGYEAGVEGASGISEKDVVLAVTRKLRALLSDSAELVTLNTRNQDTSLSVQQRIQISQNAEADLLISIHVGGAFSKETKGVAVFYPEPAAEERNLIRGLTVAAMNYSEESQEIARIVGRSIIEETGAAFRGIHPIPNPLFNQSRRPSILIEVGCLTNPEEEGLLGEESYQAKIAIGIAKGIQRLLDRVPPGQLTPTLNNQSFETERAPL